MRGLIYLFPMTTRGCLLGIASFFVFLAIPCLQSNQAMGGTLGWYIYNVDEGSVPGDLQLGDPLFSNYHGNPTITLPYGSDQAFLLCLTLLPTDAPSTFNQTISGTFNDSHVFISTAPQIEEAAPGWSERILGSHHRVNGPLYVHPGEARSYSDNLDDTSVTFGAGVFVRPELGLGYTEDFSVYVSMGARYTNGGGSGMSGTAYFDVTEPEPTTVPTPTSITALIGLCAMGGLALLRRRYRSC